MQQREGPMADTVCHLKYRASLTKPTPKEQSPSKEASKNPIPRNLWEKDRPGMLMDTEDTPQHAK
jgi:hypothetical protein